MEKEMKIIESLLLHSESTLLDDEAIALENLLKAYKELKEENERLIIEKATALQAVRKYKEMVKDRIPKSKVKEKIEEYNSIGMIGVVRALQELLEEE